MFERYTERARNVVVSAQDEARKAHHNYVGTEHLLLGLLREKDTLAEKVLTLFDVTEDEVRQLMTGIVGVGDSALQGVQLPFSPRSKKVLELSLREALSLGHNYIGTEHILLGLVREDDGVACQILFDIGLTADKVRDEVIRMLSGPGRVKTPPKDSTDLEKAHRALVVAQNSIKLAMDAIAKAGGS